MLALALAVVLYMTAALFGGIHLGTSPNESYRRIAGPVILSVIAAPLVLVAVAVC
jgi:hypothetical protein